MPTNTRQLFASNVRRHRDGAARQVARARAALPKLSAAPADTYRWRTPPVLDRYVHAVRLRIKYPYATVDRVGAAGGDAAWPVWSILRRALLMAETMPDDEAMGDLQMRHVRVPASRY